MSRSGNWNYPTPIRFGAGKISELPQACTDLGITRPLLVTDPGIAALPILQDALDVMRQSGVEVVVFSQIQGNPTGEDVDRGTAVLRSEGCDGVIAFGGGSALDVGKAVALMAGQRRPLWDYEDIGDWWTRVEVDKMVPCVAVPTTSGTGSEVGRCSVIVNTAEARKVIIFHAKMLPDRVIADPNLTVGLPPKLTAAVGMDALSHNLEAFCAPGFHPMADGIALEGMRLIKDALVRAVQHGGDVDARADMMIASTMGATAFQKGLGAMHSMSHPIGAVLHAHHGLTNAIVMPYVLRFNRDAIEGKMDTLARHLQLPTPGFDGVMRWVLELRVEIGIPHTTQALGFTEAHADTLAPAAAADPTAGTNPIPLTEAHMKTLFRNALHGQL
ncbi:MAG: alcohol dehydrogenase class IV [Myxococcota bacterium]|jgi:alcohol dehydrogenase class IV